MKEILAKKSLRFIAVSAQADGLHGSPRVAAIGGMAVDRGQRIERFQIHAHEALNRVDGGNRIGAG